ncbi:hypothetical protein GOP47_0020557 [Adiantum capillus-veneris]|uniref:Translation initiation factor IF-3 n=1 Tax=Adiantum capillus-veneris TaxID=13818 RepID=A0A9D4U9R0_ADICA|nr:hypothetical protein GOP47_0020557 [Adiantum capillus-veneris]
MVFVCGDAKTEVLPAGRHPVLETMLLRLGMVKTSSTRQQIHEVTATVTVTLTARANILTSHLKKLTPTDSSLHNEGPKPDEVVLSAGEPRISGFISYLRYVSASQRSLLWRSPGIRTTFTRGYGSTNKKKSSQSRNLKASDEDEDEDDNTDEDRLEGGADYEVLDEQRISDDDDYEVLDEQHIEEDDELLDDDEEGQEYQVPAKKKFEIQQPKPKVVDEGPMLNDKITARTLRLVDEDGKGHRIVSRGEALFLAKKKEMDLVLVDGKPDPPVCKIFDFHRERYKREQALKEKKKSKGAAAKLNEVKELRYSAKTEPKDLKMKVQKAKQFLERGYKVKFVANYKGFIEEEADRREEGKMIDKVISMLDDMTVIEQGPRYESRLVWVMFKHMKFGKVKRKKPPKPAQEVDANMEGALVGNG